MIRNKFILFLLAGLAMANVSFGEAFPRRNYKIDESVNPCENFYDYTCGPTLKSFNLPQNRSRHNFSFDDTKETLLTYKKNYFKNLQGQKETSGREKQIQAFYLACMNEEAGKKDESQHVAHMIKELEAIKTREQFAELLFKSLKNGDPGFLSFWGNLPNFKNSQKMDGYFQIDLLTLPEKTYYEKDEVIKGLKQLMVKFFESIGSPNPGEQAAWVFDFEMKLGKVFPTGVEINKRVFSLTEHSPALTKKLKYLRLGEFIGQLPSKPHIRNLFGDPAFEYVDRGIGALPLEQLKAIYLYYTLKDYMDDAYPEFRAQTTAFFAKNFGKPSERPDRQERCTNDIEQKFGMELDSILMPRIFPDFPKEKLTAMVEKIRAGLVKAVEKNTWLSPGARKAALLKLKHLNIRLVSPDSDLEWNFNKEGVYSSSAPVENKLLYGRLKLQKYVEDFKQKFENPVWEFGPLEMNAALLPPYNAIIFPVAMFQPPFYDPDAPEEVNMAAIGAVIGHELGHSIDDKGYTFDYKGRINPWIKKEDERRFFARAQPLIDQFDGTGQNGKFTLGENIGDLVGLTNAYDAAFPKGSDKPISLKRDFFIQYGRVWCEVQKPEMAELRKKVDPHASSLTRVNEQVKHQPGFAEAFACKPGDPMVLPKEKIVRIW